jgi:uncharacterized protein (DUF736 family)
MTEENKRKDELGAFWEREQKNDPSKTYLGGYVNLSVVGLRKMLEKAEASGEEEYKLNIVAFPNDFKTADNHPSYRIKKSTMKSNATSVSPQALQKVVESAVEETEEVEDLL